MGRKLKKRRQDKNTFATHCRADSATSEIRKLFAVPAVCGLLILAVIAVFGQTYGHDFINYDDNEYVYENSHVSRGLTRDGFAWALTSFHASNWHPLTWLSHMLDCQFYQLHPGGHHLTNVLFHASAAVILFLALRRMTGALWPCAWVAAIFAIHPQRVESVAWVAERKDVLSGLFFASTHSGSTPAPRRASGGAAAQATLIDGGLLCTGLDGQADAGDIAVHSAFARLLAAATPGPLFFRRTQQRGAKGVHSRDKYRPLIEKISLFVLAAAACAITLVAQHHAIRPLEELSLSARLANAALAYVTYIGKMLYPSGLAVLYPLPSGPPPVLEVTAAFALLIGVSTTAVIFRRKCPYLFVGWLWYLGALTPVIGLVQVGNQAMADRYTYLPHIGLSIAMAWGAADVASNLRYPRWPLAALAALVLAGLMICAWRQTRLWRDAETLYEHTLACTSRNPIIHKNLGDVLVGRGQVDQAIDQYRQAVDIEPDYAAAHNNLGWELAARGQIDEAIDPLSQGPDERAKLR